MYCKWLQWAACRGVCRRGSLVLTHTHIERGGGGGDRQEAEVYVWVWMRVWVWVCVARLFDKWQQFFLHIFFMLFALVSVRQRFFPLAHYVKPVCLSLSLFVCLCVLADPLGAAAAAANRLPTNEIVNFCWQSHVHDVLMTLESRFMPPGNCQRATRVLQRQ